MRNILYGPKHIYLDGTTQYKTATLREMDQLIDRCFAMNGQQWQTGQFHSLPDKKDVEGGISNVCVNYRSLVSSANCCHLSTVKFLIRCQPPKSALFTNCRLLTAIEQPKTSDASLLHLDL